MSLENLPQEIIKEILSYNNEITVRIQLGSTCKMLQEYLKFTTMNCWSTTSQEFMYSALMEDVEDLDISGNYCITDIRHLKKVKVLSCSCSSISSDGIRGLPLEHLEARYNDKIDKVYGFPNLKKAKVYDDIIHCNGSELIYGILSFMMFILFLIMAFTIHVHMFNTSSLVPLNYSRSIASFEPTKITSTYHTRTICNSLATKPCYSPGETSCPEHCKYITDHVSFDAQGILRYNVSNIIYEQTTRISQYNFEDIITDYFIYYDTTDPKKYSWHNLTTDRDIPNRLSREDILIKFLIISFSVSFMFLWMSFYRIARNKLSMPEK